MGLLSNRSYVYFALKIDGVTQAMQEINTNSFCKKWGLLENDFLIAIASLNKKGIVDLDVPKLITKAYSYQEKIDSTKKQINEIIN